MALLSRSYEHNVMMRHEKICKLQISNVSIGQVRSDIWAVAGPPVPGSAIISRGKAPGRVLLSGGVKRKKSPPPPKTKACAKLTAIICTYFSVSQFSSQAESNVLRYALDRAKVFFM